MYVHLLRFLTHTQTHRKKHKRSWEERAYEGDRRSERKDETARVCVAPEGNGPEESAID